MLRCPVVLISFALLLFAGCNSGVGGRDTRPWCERPDGPYENERALYAAYCDAMERCGIGIELGYAFECRQECVQSFDFGLTCGIADDEYDIDRWNRKLEERQVVYDEERGAECIDWWEDADCEVVERLLASGVDYDDDSALPGACRNVLDVESGGGPLPGTVAEGQACDSDYHCQEGLFCYRPESGQVTYCAVCQPLPGPGEPCYDYDCGTGARCDSSQDPYMCVALLADGQPCEDHYVCLSQRCYGNLCIALLPDGRSCEDALQCESNFCYEGACMSRLEEGEPCSEDAPCISLRCHEGYCISINNIGEPCDHHAYCQYSCYQGLCIEDHDPGEPCDEDVNCRWDSICYQGACIEYNMLPVGAPCENEYDCATGLCLDQVCAEWKEPGEPCTVDDECRHSDICFTDGLCGMPNGEDCYTHSQCRSERCPGYIVCADPLEDGQPCTMDGECLSWDCIEGLCHTMGESGDACLTTAHCEGGLFCDPQSQTCEYRVHSGQPCTVDDGCREGFCDPATSLCGFPAGDACENDEECQGFCDSIVLVCADPLAEGQECDRDAQCMGYCVYGDCRALKPYGTECLYDEECEGGICGYDYNRFRCRGFGECFEQDDCEPGFWCDEDEWPSPCLQLKFDGESCEEDHECFHYCYNVCVEKKPFGASCTEDQECQEGLCDSGECSRPGLCWSDSDCPQGQFCDRDLYQPMCTAPKPDGSHCEEDPHCQSGWCSPISEICKVRPELGDPCESWECPPSAYCLNGTCRARKLPGSACDEDFMDDAECLAPAICRNGKCETMPLECIPAESGEICTFLMVCAEDAYCDMLDNFTCKKRSKVGQTCTTLMWGANTCEEGSYCQEEKCVAYAQVGESCSAGPCDPRDSWCDSATCSEKKYAGELCNNDSECIGGDCDYQGDDVYRCDGPCKMPE